MHTCKRAHNTEIFLRVLNGPLHSLSLSFALCTSQFMWSDEIKTPQQQQTTELHYTNFKIRWLMAMSIESFRNDSVLYALKQLANFGKSMYRLLIARIIQTLYTSDFHTLITIYLDFGCSLFMVNGQFFHFFGSLSLPPPRPAKYRIRMAHLYGQQKTRYCDFLCIDFHFHFLSFSLSSLFYNYVPVSTSIHKYLC